MNEILQTLITVIAPIFVGIVIAVIYSLLEYIFRRRTKEKTKPYGVRISELTKSLASASDEVDRVLKEMEVVSQDRTTSIVSLEMRLTQLGEEEGKLQTRIKELEETPIPVAEHFASLVAQGERRGAWRDYILFGLGVVVSTIVAVVLGIIGL